MAGPGVAGRALDPDERGDVPVLWEVAGMCFSHPLVEEEPSSQAARGKESDGAVLSDSTPRLLGFCLSHMHPCALMGISGKVPWWKIGIPSDTTLSSHS